MVVGQNWPLLDTKKEQLYWSVEVSIVTSTLALPSLGEELLQVPGVLVRDCPRPFSVLVAEGIPPLPQKTVDRYKNAKT